MMEQTWNRRLQASTMEQGWNRGLFHLFQLIIRLLRLWNRRLQNFLIFCRKSRGGGA